MKMFGLDLKTDMLKIDDLELLEFEPYFKGHCRNPGDKTAYCGKLYILKPDFLVRRI